MKLSRNAVLFLLLAVSPAIADDHDSLIPGRFIFKGGHAPIWISEREMFQDDGSLRKGVLDDLHMGELSRRRDWLRDRRRRGISTNAAADCDVNFIGYVSQGGGSDPHVTTFTDLRNLATRRPVITGKVTATALGIHFGMPHTVVRIDSATAGVTHLIYPHGRLRVNGMTVCNADPHYSEPPSIGDMIAVILPMPLDETGTLYWPPGSSILYEHEGRLVASPYLRDDLTLRELKSLDRVTATLLAGEHPRESHRQ